MPVCTHHPTVETTVRCTHCGRPFCEACLLSFRDARYCDRCRNLSEAEMEAERNPAAAVAGLTFTDHLIPVKNLLALSGYYVGVFSLVPCFGLLLGPAALVLGVLGLRARRRQPGLPGKAHAITALVLGSLTTLANWGILIALLVGGVLPS